MVACWCFRYAWFFSYCSGDHRDLHSFPTRRSSDLHAAGAFDEDHPRAVRIDAPELAAQRAGGRSEEHTSELQSQSNLVCRLLLEKKKYVQSNSIVGIVYIILLLHGHWFNAL